jgi:selenocysteine-specific elongation factor
VNIRHYIIATAGHVDHGKSSLVKALTGTDPDRLPEEKARQITIDLGFAELKLDGGMHAAIVDVPGHEDFVRNMIAGVGSIDLALLVVAADDGWMPQTEEHLQILEYLGVKRAVICLTKIDIGDADAAENDIRNELRETSFADAPLVRTSLTALSGQSAVAQLKSILGRELSQIEPQRDIGKPRLSVDRAFTLHGIGTVVTGTLTDGVLRRSDKIVVQPHGATARIRSMQTHGEDVDLATPGTRVALNLPDLTAKSDVSRGDVISTDEFVPANVIDATLRMSPRLDRNLALKSGATVHLHHGATRVRAKIILRNCAALHRGEEAHAQLRLHAPLFAFVGDRFIIRDASEQHTIAGGVILKVGDERADSEWLAARARGMEDIDLVVASELQHRTWAMRSDLLRHSRFSVAEISSALQRLAERGEVFLAAEVAIEIGAWKEARTRALNAIDRFHEAQSDRSGIELSDLRANLGDVAPVIVDLIVVDLAHNECVQAGSTIARRSHRAALPAQLRAMANEIVKSLSTFDPPNRKEIEIDDAHRKALRFLIERGDVLEISREIVITRSTFDEMKKRVADLIASRGGVTVSELRQALESSRRVMVPLLELLDRQGVTRRTGDRRVLAPQFDHAKLNDAARAPRN